KFTEQKVNLLPHRTRGGINPVEISKDFVRQMMIDIQRPADGRKIVVHAVDRATVNEGREERLPLRQDIPDVVNLREEFPLLRNRGDVERGDCFAQRLQAKKQTRHRSETVTVGALMADDQDAVVRA